MDLTITSPRRGSAEWFAALESLPLIAILRGIEPERAEEVGDVLLDAGFRLLEVPLNSPNAMASISTLCDLAGDRALVGAGTVLEASVIADIAWAGGKLIVAPNYDPGVLAEARQRNLICCPGVATPTEAFAAQAAGAHALKLFPGELVSPSVVRAMRAVLPAEAVLLPVGGISPDNMSVYLDAGANGFGIGSALFKPGKALSDIARDAARFVSVMQEWQTRSVG